MKITNIAAEYYYYAQQQRIKKEELKPIEPVNNIEPLVNVPEYAYLEAMSVLGSIIDIKI